MSPFLPSLWMVIMVTMIPSISFAQDKSSEWYYKNSAGEYVRASEKKQEREKPVVSSNPNEDALDGYRQGWSIGDTDIILGVVTETFNFTWVPDNDVVSKKRFPAFFQDFKGSAEADGRPKYYMRFPNIIHRQIGDILYEAADWVVDEFDRGSYFNAARGGKVIWDMATT